MNFVLYNKAAHMIFHLEGQVKKITDINNRRFSSYFI